MKLTDILDGIAADDRNALRADGSLSPYLDFMFGPAPDNTAALACELREFLLHLFLHYLNDNTLGSAAVISAPWTEDRIARALNRTRPDTPRAFVGAEGLGAALRPLSKRRFLGLFADLGPAGGPEAAQDWITAWHELVPRGTDTALLLILPLGGARPEAEPPALTGPQPLRHWPLPALDLRVVGSL